MTEHTTTNYSMQLPRIDRIPYAYRTPVSLFNNEPRARSFCSVTGVKGPKSRARDEKVGRGVLGPSRPEPAPAPIRLRAECSRQHRSTLGSQYAGTVIPLAR